MRPKYFIGSRGSDLALWQSNTVRSQLETLFPTASFEIKIISTTGDELQEVALSKIGDKGLFTRHIETALLRGEIDFAVHSLKDLQTVQPDGLIIGAVCEREKPNDVLISRRFSTLDDLPDGAKVATGSLRRRTQLLHRRPDLEIIEIRGNVPTRLNKFLESDLDGMVLAFAGLNRLGLAYEISHSIPVQIMLPAVGQAAIAVEIRKDDKAVASMAAKLNHEPTAIAVSAERAFLRHLEGGCQVPIAGLATVENGTVHLDGLVGSLDGSVVLRESAACPLSAAEQTGTKLAERLLEIGARELLTRLEQNAIPAEPVL
ncbi:MAG: hydroxymethylbilane synthase [Pyrinomonadaceae bacterium]